MIKHVPGARPSHHNVVRMSMTMTVIFKLQVVNLVGYQMRSVLFQWVVEIGITQPHHSVNYRYVSLLHKVSMIIYKICKIISLRRKIIMKSNNVFQFIICILNNIIILCIMKVYITWTGTDSRGLYFKSSASRFSRMSSIQLAEYTDSRQSIYANDNIP